MGSGINFFLNGIDVTPGTTGQWTDVDVSSHIPSGSTGVVVKINNTSSASRGEVRKNGSSDDFGYYLGGNNGRFALVGVDANRVFEAYIANSNVEIILVGYTDESCVFFDNAIEKTISTGSWQDIDASGDISSEATGVICLLINTSGSTNYSAGIRKNGSSDEFTYGDIYKGARFNYQLCGVDASRIFESRIENSAVEVYLVGYTKSPITFLTNGIDKSLSQTNEWTDIDVTSETEAEADGVIIFMKNTSSSSQGRSDVRKNGSSDDDSPMLLFYAGCCAAGLCGMDSGQVFEGYIAITNIDFYLIGYCKPGGAQTYTKTFQADVLFKKLGVTKDYATDALFKKPDIVKEMVVDALFKKPTMKDYDIDMLLKKLGTTVDYDIDMLLKQLGIMKNYDVNALLKKLGITVDYDIDVLLKTLGITKDYGVDSLFKAIIIKTYGIDAKFGAMISHTKNYSIDMLLKALGITKSYSVDTLLKKLGITKDYGIDSLFVSVIAITYSIDVLFKQLGVEKQYLIDSLYRKEFSIQYAINLLLRKSFVKDYGIDACFGVVLAKIRQYTMDVLLKKFGATKSYGIDVRFGALATHTLQFSIDAIFYRIRLVGKLTPSEKEGVLEDEGMEGVIRC